MKRVYIDVSGGVVQHVFGLPKSYDFCVIDWDDLLGDGSDTVYAWGQLDAADQAVIAQQYPEEYQQIMSAIKYQSA